MKYVDTVVERAKEHGLAPGLTANGGKTHLIEFNSRSMLVLGTDGARDKLLCGPAGDFNRTEPPEKLREFCDHCLNRLDGLRLDRVATDGGHEVDRHVCETCGKPFLTEDALRGHTAVHSERPHLVTDGGRDNAHASALAAMLRAAAKDEELPEDRREHYAKRADEIEAEQEGVEE